MKALLAAFAAALAVAASAAAGNNPTPTLDQAATSVAGHPVAVWCEDSWPAWYSFGSSQSENGFTNPAVPTVYVNPRQCETLIALSLQLDVGAYYAASALLTLAHEAIHQRGIVDEGVTDCTALPYVPTLAVQFFGIPAKVAKTVVVRGRLRTVLVANPYLARLAAYALAYHHLKPAAYQGGC